MKLMVASYNNGGAAWNAEAEETNFLHYRIGHRFDEPASVEIILMDPTGTMAQKYNADTNDVYLGAGKVTIEDPNGTDIFYGRIMKAEPNMADRTLTLYCEDWLSQLNEQQVDYDMREALNAAGLRESTLLPDWDETDGVGGIRPAFDAGGGVIYIYDNHRVLTADAHNNKYLMFTDAIAGKKTWTTGPYDAITTNGGVETGDESDMWDDDDANGYDVIDNNASWTQDVLFRVLLGDETDTINNNYVAASLTGARVRVTYSFRSTVLDDLCDIQIHVDTNADGTPDAYKTIGQLKLYDSALGSIKEREAVFTIPEEMFDGTVGDQIVSGAGVARVRFNVVWGSGVTQLTIFKIDFEVDCSTTGMSDIATIADGETYRLTVNVDFADPTKKVWTGCTYSIARPIYLHFEDAAGPINGYDSMVTLTCGAAQVENTAGISLRKYIGKTPLEIAQDLAQQDKSHFWLALGGTTVTYKYSFTDAVADATLTDADVLYWQSSFDYQKVINKCIVYGMQIGEQRLSATYSDATSIAKYKQTRTKIITDTGLTCEGDALARATAIVNQYKDPLMILTAVIPGNVATAAHAKTMLIGDEVQVTSSYLGLTNAWYIVQRYEYDSHPDVNTSTVTLHPRVSQTGLQKFDMPNYQRAMQQVRRGTADTYIAHPGDTT